MKYEHITKEYLEEKLKEGGTVRSIAHINNANEKTILKRIKKYNITHQYNPGRRLKDLTGQTFGRLVVEKFILDQNERKNKEKSYWQCRCECGNVPIIRRDALISGATRSCGCYDADVKFKGVGEISKGYWNAITSSAIRRKIDFNITMEYAWDLFLKQDRKCILTGLELHFLRGYTKNYRQTASLDRIDSSKPYEIGNCQWTHKVINVMKHVLSQEEFILICRLVVQNWEKNNVIDC